MARKTIKRTTRVKRKTAKAKVEAPSIAQLSRQLDKAKCDHLVGRAVIEQQVADLARGKLDANYCQNWDRCPDNDWGKCTPDAKAWMRQVIKTDLVKALTPTEIKTLRSLKFSRMK